VKRLGPQKGAFGTQKYCNFRGPFLLFTLTEMILLSVCLYSWALLLQSISKNVCYWPNRCVRRIFQTSSTVQDPHVSTITWFT